LLNIMLIALGGAIGSVLRYLTSTGMHALLGRDFPYGTLTVNVIGSWLMGFLAIIILARFANLADELRSLLLIGFLGGYTTFSAFSIESFNLLSNGLLLKALLNILLSITLCLLATWLGFIVAKSIFP
jgi:CrcB protein